MIDGFRRYLGFAYNKLDGTIPASTGNLTKLRLLKGDYNAIEGSLPEELGQLTSLVYVCTACTQLGQLTSLVYTKSRIITSLPVFKMGPTIGAGFETRLESSKQKFKPI